MRANEFVKKFGWDVAKHKADELKIIENMGDKLSIEDSTLIRLVESYELVQTGLQELKDKMFSNDKTIDDVKQWVLTANESLLTPKGLELKQAIKIVESCQ